jgi:hypothetical protein
VVKPSARSQCPRDVEAHRVTANRAYVAFLVASTPDAGNPDAVPPKTIRRWHDEDVMRWLRDLDNTSALLDEVDVLAVPTPGGARGSCWRAQPPAADLVASGVDGCREVLDYRRNGLLVPQHDPRGASRGGPLLDDPEPPGSVG